MLRCAGCAVAKLQRARAQVRCVASAQANVRGCHSGDNGLNCCTNITKLGNLTSPTTTSSMSSHDDSLSFDFPVLRNNSYSDYDVQPCRLRTRCSHNAHNSHVEIQDAEVRRITVMPPTVWSAMPPASVRRVARKIQKEVQPRWLIKGGGSCSFKCSALSSRRCCWLSPAVLGASQDVAEPEAASLVRPLFVGAQPSELSCPTFTRC